VEDKMSEMDTLATIDLMQRRIEHLEEELDKVRTILERVLVTVPPLIFTMPDGSKRPFRPNRPVSLQTLATLVRVDALSQERRHLSADERTKLFLQNIEEARAEAIAKGTAIENEWEAALGD
jgi:hypothetical protein